jgi:hypothetical protein
VLAAGRSSSARKLSSSDFPLSEESAEAGAEAMVPLRAGHLSDGAPPGELWRQRQAQATGQRPYRRAG